jgi:hypothetical protein
VNVKVDEAQEKFEEEDKDNKGNDEVVRNQGNDEVVRIQVFANQKERKEDPFLLPSKL